MKVIMIITIIENKWIQTYTIFMSPADCSMSMSKFHWIFSSHYFFYTSSSLAIDSLVFIYILIFESLNFTLLIVKWKWSSWNHEDRGQKPWECKGKYCYPPLGNFYFHLFPFPSHHHVTQTFFSPSWWWWWTKEDDDHVAVLKIVFVSSKFIIFSFHLPAYHHLHITHLYVYYNITFLCVCVSLSLLHIILQKILFILIIFWFIIFHNFSYQNNKVTFYVTSGFWKFRLFHDMQAIREEEKDKRWWKDDDDFV